MLDLWLKTETIGNSAKYFDIITVKMMINAYKLYVQ